ncbi:MAG TPA: TauD/TfdA family dioxygenase [Spongiibacteraceae bacterium]|jgi:taurine dioxygenase
MSNGSFQRLSWRDISPFGVEVDYDLRQPMTPEEQAAFKELFFKESLLVFHRQTLSEDEQVRVTGYLGPITPPEAELRRMEAVGAQGVVEFSFHSDYSFGAEPIIGISLHALDVVEGESYTRFASGIRAYRALPAELKAKADSHRIHSSMMAGRIEPGDEIPQHWPQVIRDVVMPHPVTGAPILYVIEQHAVRILDIEVGESEKLMREFAAYLFAEDSIYRHEWVNGDFVVWDNLALQHARPELSTVTRRVLQRATVATKTFFELFPDFHFDANFSLEDKKVGRWAKAPT